MWCDLHGHDNELVTVSDYVHIENNRNVLGIKSIGICEAGLSKQGRIQDFPLGAPTSDTGAFW